MGIIEFVALIALFVLCTAFMVIITVCQYRQTGRMDELSNDRKAMRDELTSLRERLKGLEVRKEFKGNE